ncbi:MAG TPA: Gmad2 immunoglobulin-like domain-containing protein [Candidatus Paceibacterota bacterium]
MKQSYYWIGAIVVIIIIVVIVLGMHKPAAAPTTQAISVVTTTPVNSGTNTTSTTKSTPVVKPTNITPTTSTITIHVKKGGQTVWYSSPTTTVSSEIIVENPPKNTTATSPMSVSGQAKGSWFSEATMPIFLTDAKGKVLAQGTVRAQSDWMTDAMVPFLGQLTFPRQPTGSTGAFVIRNDNPSGIAANQKQVEILVTFN